MVSNLTEEYFKDVKNPSFERRVHEEVQEFLDLQSRGVPKEVSTLRHARVRPDLR